MTATNEAGKVYTVEVMTVSGEALVPYTVWALNPNAATLAVVKGLIEFGHKVVNVIGATVFVENLPAPPAA
jgi:hypothetical protein